MSTLDVFGDIETIRTQRPEVLDWIAKNLPSTPGASFEECEAAMESAVDATALDGALGEIACIAMATGANDPKTWARALGDSERDLLLQFRSDFAELDGKTSSRGNSIRLVGHNFLDFDRNFIRKRFIVHGLKPPWQFICEIKPWENGVVFDTMKAWAGQRGTISQDRLALALGLPGKGDVDGSKVWALMKAGRWQDVATYCANDVITVRAIFRKLTTLE